MRRGRARRAVVVTAGLMLPLGWLLTAPADGAAPGADHTETLTIADRAEAWYASSPVDICTTPLGCPPSTVPTSPYPADTLHVGVAGGQETARTYLLPDLSALPFGATPVSGTMTLPVAAGTTDGTVSAGTAKVLACLATAAAPDGTSGVAASPPAVNCAVAQGLDYDAAKNVFTLNLTPFLTAWANGSAMDGIALIPSRTVQQTDAWHVTFNGHKRAGAGHISGVVTVSVTDDTTVPVPASVPPPPVTSLPAPPPAVTVPNDPGAVAVAPAPPPLVAPQAAPQQVAPVAFSRSFQYPLAFLLPLALLAGGVFFARLFTRDVTPVRP